MTIIKKIFLRLVALLAWQFLVMKKKDSNFKKQVNKREGTDKLKYIFDRLLSFNKELIWEAKESVEALDSKQIKEKVTKSKAWVQAEYTTLKESMIDLEWWLEWMSKEKIKKILKQFKWRFTELESTVKDLGVDLDKKYAWKKKRSELKKLYDSLEKKA